MGEQKLKYLKENELNEFFIEIENRRNNVKTAFEEKVAIRNEAAFKLMYYLALRVSETSNLTIDDYDSLKKTCYCNRLKNGNSNTIPLLDERYDKYEVLNALERHISLNTPEHFLFYNFNTKNALSRKTFDKTIRSYFKKTSIPEAKWHCHTLRHSRAITLAEESQFDLKDLMFFLGHKEIKNTQIYFQYTLRQQNEMLKKMQIPRKIINN